MTDKLSPSPDVAAYELMRAGRLEEALTFARRAILDKRICLPAHGLLATLLLRLGRMAEANQVVVEALEWGAGSPDAVDALAHVSMLMGEHDRSNELYRKAVELAPSDARFWYNLASSERSFGRLDAAEAACDRAIALDPAHLASYLMRSELRTQTPERNHVEQLQIRLSRLPPGDRTRTPLGYALATELDDLQQFDAAFRWFAEAATTRRRHLNYDVAIDLQKLRHIEQAFPASVLDRKAALQDGSNQYVFIIGLPRSGTTLLERMLTNLAGTRSNGETDNFARALFSQLKGSAFHEAGEVFRRAAAADPTAVAEHYARFANPDGARSVIIEKLPINYLYVGAIRRALPQATMILVRRSPVESCFAMYRTLFDQAYPFSYDFDDLARYYAGYERLIAHWRSALGGDLHEIVYDDLVRNSAVVGASIAAKCGLAWNDAAIDIQHNASTSFTASAAQVRRPIYQTSSGRWLKYRAHLQPLLTALQQQGVASPEVA